MPRICPAIHGLSPKPHPIPGSSWVLGPVQDTQGGFRQPQWLPPLPVAVSPLQRLPPPWPFGAFRAFRAFARRWNRSWWAHISAAMDWFEMVSGEISWKSKLDTMVFAMKYDVPVHLPGNQSNEEWDCTFISFVWLTWQTRQQFNIYLTNHPPCKINHLGVSNKYPNIPTMGFLVGFITWNPQIYCRNRWCHLDDPPTWCSWWANSTGFNPWFIW